MAAPKQKALEETNPSNILANRPAYLKEGDRTGTEDITVDELRLPRIAIAQSPSPQLLEDSSVYIEGLRMFDMFNDLTGTVYGRGPLTFIPIRRDVRRIEFSEDGKTVINLNVAPDDVKNDWTDGANGERIAPKATKFVEFVVLLLNGPNGPKETAVLSIKDTNKHNRRAIERLLGFILSLEAPIYAGMYTLESKPEKNDSGTFGVPIINLIGWTPETMLLHAEGFAKSLKGKKIAVTREAAGAGGDVVDADVVGTSNGPDM